MHLRRDFELLLPVGHFHILYFTKLTVQKHYEIEISALPNLGKFHWVNQKTFARRRVTIRIASLVGEANWQKKITVYMIVHLWF